MRRILIVVMLVAGCAGVITPPSVTPSVELPSPATFTEHMATHEARPSAEAVVVASCLTPPMDANHLMRLGQGSVIEAVVGTIVVANCTVDVHGVCEIRAPYPCGAYPGSETGAVGIRARGDVVTHSTLIWEQIHVAGGRRRRPSRG